MSIANSSKFCKLTMISLTGILLLFFQNCGKPFQAAEVSGVTTQSSSLSNLPPANKFNGEVDLAWDRTTLNEDNSAATIMGYKIYIGNASGNYSTVIGSDVVGNYADHRLTGLVSGRNYYFAVSAVSIDGTESSRSVELAYTAP